MIVVVLTPLLDDGGDFDGIAEPLHRQALVAKLTVEALRRAVLPGLVCLSELAE